MKTEIPTVESTEAHAAWCIKTLYEAMVRVEAERAAAKSVIQGFLDYAEEPPAPNCSCHISPPCEDCVSYSALREVFDSARAIMKEV